MPKQVRGAVNGPNADHPRTEVTPANHQDVPGPQSTERKPLEEDVLSQICFRGLPRDRMGAQPSVADVRDAVLQ